MGKKRKSDASRLDEVDRSMYATFCSAANSLSQLYTNGMHQQRLSFQAGERHAMEKLYSWILRQEEGGVRVMTGDIAAYVQNELDYGTEEGGPPASPRQGVSVPSNTLCPTSRLGNPDQTKNSVFSNALSSPVRRSLQHYHLSQAQVGSTRGNEIRDTNPPSSNDTSMDMHSDSPTHDSPY